MWPPRVSAPREKRSVRLTMKGVSNVRSTSTTGDAKSVQWSAIHSTASWANPLQRAGGYSLSALVANTEVVPSELRPLPIASRWWWGSRGLNLPQPAHGRLAQCGFNPAEKKHYVSWLGMHLVSPKLLVVVPSTNLRKMQTWWKNDLRKIYNIP